MIHERIRRVAALFSVLALMSLGIRSAYADPTFNDRSEIDFVAAGCGEPVHVSGEVHWLLQETGTASGSYRYELHANYSDVSGVGLQTGTRFQATWASNATLFVPADGPREGNYALNIQLISQTAAENLVVHSLFHITIAESGAITADQGTYAVECRG